MRYILSVLMFLVVFVACQKHSNSDIAGNWNAVEISQQGDSLEVDLNEISFQFTEDGRYQFYSTLKYHEAGIFYLNGPFLFSTDTTQATPQDEKAVEILQLNGDTLILRMEADNKEQVMVLQKTTDQTPR